MRRQRARRWRTLVVAVSLIGATGAALRWHELGHGEDAVATPRDARPDVAAAVSERGGVVATPTASAHAEALARRFHQGVVMLHAREYENAAVAFDRVLTLAPRLPEARVNMGYAMLGQGRADRARDHFTAAIDLRPTQRNAYYGLAESLEALGDTAGAVGAMRTYVHLSPPGDPFVRKARAALWEWQAGGPGTAAQAGPGEGGTGE